MEDDRSSPLPEFKSIPGEKWKAGEAPIVKVLNRVSPTADSEDKRKELIQFMRQLILNVGGVEVVHYGSVPLKTYLPDGDIDLTVLSIPDWERNLPCEVYDVLLDEQLYGNKDCKIEKIKFIDAEEPYHTIPSKISSILIGSGVSIEEAKVKIVKCIVNGVVIDVSFNQLSGLCALCFLEQVDRLIGKDHLFKRSIILIKSWCYYESHTLGAIYGLLSTYALETLVLYIFLMYNASLTCPLKVLYRFLEYYNKFDWGKFCISIDGPVRVSSLPDIVVENPVDRHPLLGGDSLRDSLKEYINIFTVPCKESLGYMPTFTPKVINIIDPLKANNNLGRSVHLGTFYRITLALSRGARELGAIMSLPKENIQEGIEHFFDRALKMNESKYILKPRSLDPMSMNPIPEVHHGNGLQTQNLNSDRDTRINGNGGLERNDVSALGLVDANEASGANGNKNSTDNGKGKVSGGFDECDTLKLAGLSGDYYGNVRTLLYSQCCQGFPYFTFILKELAGRYPLGAWFEQNFSHVQAYPNGSVMLPEPNLSVHVSDTYVLPMGPPASANGWGHVPPFPNPHPNRALGSTYETSSSSSVNNNSPDSQSPQGHGQSSAPIRVRTQRKLVFGSFGPVVPTNPEPNKTDFLCGGRAERVVNNSLPLMDENEFPPLSV